MIINDNYQFPTYFGFIQVFIHLALNSQSASTNYPLVNIIVSFLLYYLCSCNVSVDVVGNLEYLLKTSLGGGGGSQLYLFIYLFFLVSMCRAVFQK